MRLTKADERFGYYYNGREDEIEFDVLSKLGQLEDIEEELGIDLITKLKTECYYMETYKNHSSYVYVLTNKNDIESVLIYNLWPTAITVIGGKYENEKFELNYNDYGKTWALTKEELE